MKKKTRLLLLPILLTGCSNSGIGSTLMETDRISSPSSISDKEENSNIGIDSDEIPLRLRQIVSKEDFKDCTFKEKDDISVTYTNAEDMIEYRVAPYPTYMSKERIVQYTITNPGFKIFGVTLSMNETDKIDYFRSQFLSVHQIKPISKKDTRSFYFMTEETYYLFSTDKVIITTVKPNNIESTWEQSDYYKPSRISDRSNDQDDITIE